MSLGDQSGYRRVSKLQDLERWRHYLVSEIRRSSRYRDAINQVRDVWEADGRPGYAKGRLDHLSPPNEYQHASYWGEPSLGVAPVNETSNYAKELHQAAIRFGLVKHGEPTSWAISHIHLDIAGMWSDTPPSVVTGGHHRSLSLHVNNQGANVFAYNSGDTNGTITSLDVITPDQPLMLGLSEWKQLEDAAVEAARQAVADMKAAVAADASLKRVAIGRSAGKARRIRNIARRLSGIAGGLTLSRAHRNLCDELGIDRPFTGIKRTRKPG